MTNERIYTMEAAGTTTWNACFAEDDIKTIVPALTPIGGRIVFRREPA